MRSVSWRSLVGLACGAAVGWGSALVLGEYELEGLLPLGAGALVGFTVGEVVGSIARSRAWWLATFAALWAAGALVQAGRIDSGEGLEPIKAGAWWGAALSAVLAAARVRFRPVGDPGPS